MAGTAARRDAARALAGLVAAAFDLAAVLDGCDFNGLDAPWCDALAAERFPMLPDDLAATFLDRAPEARPTVALEGFLEVFFWVFLDIRLPFVAFDRSIIRVLQEVS
ncbi:hypothetical protein [Bradyrhizobium sp.]|uniref:hypothetical protein n=1 Tax=Bradyrhizobium sp. TaxID=376 RepID=UPI003445F5A6